LGKSIFLSDMSKKIATQYSLAGDIKELCGNFLCPILKEKLVSPDFIEKEFQFKL